PLGERNLVKRHFKPILEKANLPKEIRLYDLRHTHATLALANGINVKVVSERLGHASAAMTLDVYTHTLPGQQEEATRILERVIFSEPKGPLAAG
ncbi:MAG: site-specific integrase, partial [Myxococcota bacterium]